MPVHSNPRRLSVLVLLTALSLLGATPRARACGGLFCSSANPVNQAAEQIIFTQNPDGTVTAAIQILYEGPSESFAWVLPVKGVPDVAVSSELAFQRLKQATNPQYRLTTQFDDSCVTQFGATSGAGFAGAGGTGGNGGAGGSAAEAPVVVVKAAGTVGPYDWEVISVVEGQADPAQVALDWLDDNGYDVDALGPAVLRPYLADGLNLLAFKLTKTAATGSIRPVLITYEGTTPSIPIRPTAVAANDDMGVMVFLLAAHRAIPKNYKGLELNEALIDWFNPNNNYNDVVSRAANEAEGQGFVTEFAGDAEPYAEIVMSEFEEANWLSFRNEEFASPAERLRMAVLNYSGWDGLDDAVRAAVTLPPTLTYDDFKLCIDCYAAEATIDEAALMQALADFVIKPMQDTRKLFEDLPYLTRLYTTLSAEEMTTDPVFDINPDLQPVSNSHNATRIVSCPDSENPSFQIWRVELPQGDVVRGIDAGVWPVQLEDAPAALRIVQFSTSGAPRVVIDAAAKVKTEIKDRNEMTMGPAMGMGSDDGTSMTKADDDGGCRVAQPRELGRTGLGLLAIAGYLLWRRRRHA